MNPLIFFFFLSIFLEDYFFREGKFIKYYLYLIGFYSIFYYFQHRSTFHSHSKKFNMAAFDQSFDSTVYARVKFNISKAKEYIKKLSEKTQKDINLTIYWIKVDGDAFVRVPESNEKIRFGLKGKRKTVDISILINAKGNEMTYLTIRDVPNKTFEQVYDEYVEKSEKLKKGQDAAYNKTRYFLKFIPSL